MLRPEKPSPVLYNHGRREWISGVCLQLTYSSTYVQYIYLLVDLILIGYYIRTIE